MSTDSDRLNRFEGLNLLGPFGRLEGNVLANGVTGTELQAKCLGHCEYQD